MRVPIANEAIDEVRRAEFLRKGGRMRGLMKGRRWLLLSRCVPRESCLSSLVDGVTTKLQNATAGAAEETGIRNDRPMTGNPAQAEGSVREREANAATTKPLLVNRKSVFNRFSNWLRFARIRGAYEVAPCAGMSEMAPYRLIARIPVSSAAPPLLPDSGVSRCL